MTIHCEKNYKQEEEKSILTHQMNYRLAFKLFAIA